MKKVLIVGLIVLVVLALIVVGSYATMRNAMVTKSETVKSAWAQVDNTLQRRADLIPNLVATVKGFAAQEQTVFHDVDAARAALLGAQTPESKIAANGQLDGALSRLLLIVENYPKLKSDESFLKLQDELAGTENRIAVARKNYNDAIQDYNTYIGRFPNNIVANMAGFQRNNAYFQASEASKEVPKVEFPAPTR
ncbi:MAG: LemA family protein [Candidatus Acidiferrales bacterium]